MNIHVQGTGYGEFDRLIVNDATFHPGNLMNDERLRRAVARGEPLVDEALSLDESLIEPVWDEFCEHGRPLRLQSCQIRGVNLTGLIFDQSVQFDDCDIDGDVWFYGTYFRGGLHLRNCRVTGEVSLMDAGHNRSDAAVRLEDCTFDGHVTFDDAWFGGPVEVTGCAFVGGTDFEVFVQPPFGVEEGTSVLWEDNSVHETGDEQ